MQDFILYIVFALFAIASIVLLYSTFSTRAISIEARDEAKRATEAASKETEEKEPDFLFFIGSDDAETVTVDVNENNSNLISITMPTKSSKLTAFTNIPAHKSFDAGNLISADLFFNRSKSDPIDTSSLPEDQAESIEKIINSQEQPFIDKEPNCSLSFTQQSGDDNIQINHIDTIAKMTSLKNNPETGKTTISFIILDGNKLIPANVYEYVAITVDDFWNLAAAITGTVALCGTLEVLTAGAGTPLCAVAAVAIIGDYGRNAAK
jgi:hypothetical protein